MCVRKMYGENKWKWKTYRVAKNLLEAAASWPRLLLLQEIKIKRKQKLVGEEQQQDYRESVCVYMWRIKVTNKNIHTYIGMNAN